MAKKRTTSKRPKSKSKSKSKGKRKGGKKGFLSTKKGKITVAAAAGIGLFFLLSGSKRGGAEVEVSLLPIEVVAGTDYSVKSCRVIAERRSGMHYDPVSSGQPGSDVSFTPTVSGMFTRNFVREEGALWAEIKAS